MLRTDSSRNASAMRDAVERELRAPNFADADARIAPADQADLP
jgi:hypothetical protein